MSETSLRNADIDAALAEVKQDYIARNPKSLARHVEATAVMPGGNTRTVLHYDPFPLAVARAEGCRLHDMDGAEYVDFLGEYTAGIYGHSHPAIRAAVERAMGAGINYGAHNLIEARFARAVCDRFGLERVRFTNSGTEANLMALVTARAFTGRSRILAFTGGYHGAVFTFAGGGSPINAPFDFVQATYNDIAGTVATIEREGDRLAAIILEPMMGGGGCIAAEPAVPASIARRGDAGRRAADLRRGDDLAARPERLGAGARRDGGFDDARQIRGRRHVLRRLRRARRHPRQVRPAPPRRPAARRHVQQQRADHVRRPHRHLRGIHAGGERRLNERGEALRARLNALCAAADAPIQFTGIGSMLAFHAVRGPVRSPSDAARGDAKLKELFFFDMLAQGIWLARRGMMTLSLPIGDAECDKLAGAVEEFLSARRSLLHEGAAAVR